MPGRSFSSPSYRYGYGGKEKVDEIDGVSGADYDFGDRMFESRLGRFLSLDPLKGISNKSPYSYAGNSPILFIDKNGAYQLTAEQQKQYPVLTNILTNITNIVLAP